MPSINLSTVAAVTVRSFNDSTHGDCLAVIAFKKNGGLDTLYYKQGEYFEMTISSSGGTHNLEIDKQSSAPTQYGQKETIDHYETSFDLNDSSFGRDFGVIGIDDVRPGGNVKFIFQDIESEKIGFDINANDFDVYLFGSAASSYQDLISGSPTKDFIVQTESMPAV